MATGDQNDTLSRLQRWLPQGWFPNTSGTFIYALLSGFASVLSTIYGLIAYAALQTRVATATDGFLDLASQDYLGDNLPRLPGETDAAFSARIRANVFLGANTRANLQSALETITGAPVRMIEPWQPNDTFVWGKSFWGVDTRTNPGQWSNGGNKYCGMVVCSLPATGLSGIPRSWWGKFFWNYGSTYATAAGAWWLAINAEAGPNIIYTLILRLKVFSTSIFVKFLPPNEIA